MSEPAAPGVALDLRDGEGRAVLWGLASEDLNVNLVSWPAGDGVGEHRNATRDVLVVVTEGTLDVTIDEQTHGLVAPSAVVIPKGAARRFDARTAVRYLTAHRRREGITIDS